MTAIPKLEALNDRIQVDMPLKSISLSQKLREKYTNENNFFFFL